MTACGSSREVARSSDRVATYSTERAEKEKDSVVVTIRDTVREVTTIHIQTNEAGDTIRMSTVTDRDRSRLMADVRSKKEETRVIRDTVYVEKRDSSFIKNTNLTNGTNRASPVVSSLKWIFWIIIALAGLIITITITKTITKFY